MSGALLALVLQTSALAAPLELGPNSVLVYRNTAGDEPERQFVVRIARFRPDLVLEWDSESHQGTIHIGSAAVASARRLSLSGLFEAGVDTESKDATTKWLSLELFAELARKGKVKVHLNAFPSVLELKGRSTTTLEWNREEIEVPVLEVVDSRKGRWLILDEPGNPLIIEHSSRYHRERLAVVATNQKGSLRWIKRLPPVH